MNKSREYDECYRAYQFENKQESACPYYPNTQQSQDWLNGWRDAFEDGQ